MKKILLLSLLSLSTVPVFGAAWLHRALYCAPSRSVNAAGAARACRLVWGGVPTRHMSTLPPHEQEEAERKRREQEQRAQEQKERDYAWQMRQEEIRKEDKKFREKWTRIEILASRNQMIAEASLAASAGLLALGSNPVIQTIGQAFFFLHFSRNSYNYYLIKKMYEEKLKREQDRK